MYADLVAQGRKRSVKDRLNDCSAYEPRRTMLPDAKRMNNERHDATSPLVHWQNELFRNAKQEAIETREKFHSSTSNNWQRHSEGILRYDTYNDVGPSSSTKVDAKDLRQKLQRKAIGKEPVLGSYIRDKLSGTMHQEPIKSEKLPGCVLQQRVKSEKLPGPMLQWTANCQLLNNKAVAELGRPVQKGVPMLKETLRETEKVAFPVASNKNSHKKSESSVDSLLQSLGLEKYSIAFKAEEVDMTVLKHMTDEDLKTIGLPMGPRKKILLALK